MAHEALCRECALDTGLDAWCDGHAEDARAHLRWAAALPPEWPTVVRLWWVATGEVRLEQLVITPAVAASLSSEVQAELPELGT